MYFTGYAEWAVVYSYTMGIRREHQYFSSL